MANYTVINCTSQTTYIISADTLSSGTTIHFNISEVDYCGIVIDETTITPHEGIYISTETDCCTCLTANTSFQSFVFITCDTSDEILVDINTFCLTYNDVPKIDETFSFYNLETQEILCMTFKNISMPSGTTIWEPVSGPYNSCNDCYLNGTPNLSAGTEYKVCVVCNSNCCDDPAHEVVTPHPTWTGLDGKAIVLLDAVVLGGINGLNS